MWDNELIVRRTSVLSGHMSYGKWPSQQLTCVIFQSAVCTTSALRLWPRRTVAQINFMLRSSGSHCTVHQLLSVQPLTRSNPTRFCVAVKSWDILTGMRYQLLSSYKKLITCYFEVSANSQHLLQQFLPNWPKYIYSLRKRMHNKYLVPTTAELQ